MPRKDIVPSCAFAIHADSYTYGYSICESIHKFNRIHGASDCRKRGATPDAKAALRRYNWPGNIRELENILERAVILNAGETLEIAAELLPPTQATEGQGLTGRTSLTSLRGAEREHILAALEKANWVIEGAGGAAKILDIHPNTLRSRLKRLGIERP